VDALADVGFSPATAAVMKTVMAKRLIEELRYERFMGVAYI